MSIAVLRRFRRCQSPTASLLEATTGTPFSPNISAVFFAAFGASGSFDDTFEFTIPQNGIGSGSISTSFSGADILVITDLIINGVSYSLTDTGSGQTAAVGNVPILNGVLNTIRVIGTVTGSGLYSGTATFSAVAIPEPATWAMMIGGLGLVGMQMRRRKTAVSFA